MTVPFSLIVPGAAAIFFAILMVFQRSLYSSAICLLLVLLQIAALFFVFGAQLLGLLQVIIYAGAVMVLIVVAIMAAAPKTTALWADLNISPWFAGAVIGVGLIEGWSLYHLGTGAAPAVTGGASGLEREMAGFLFGPYALMTEIIGIMILISSLAIVQDSK